MLYETAPQAAEFAVMLLAGMLMGLTSMGFSLLRHLMRAGLLLCAVCDMMMGLVWAAIACAALSAACLGQARAFHFFAMLSGMLLLRAALMPPGRAAFRGFLLCISRLGDRLKKTRAVRMLFK